MYLYDQFILKCEKLYSIWNDEYENRFVPNLKQELANQIVDQHYRRLVMSTRVICRCCGPVEEESTWDIIPEYIYPALKYGVTICSNCYNNFHSEILIACTRKALFTFVPGFFENSGHPIAVRRSNGTIENDWIFDESIMAYSDKMVYVKNDRLGVSKKINLSEVYELNQNAQIDFSKFPNEFGAVDFAMIMRIIGKNEIIKLKNNMLEELNVI